MAALPAALLQSELARIRRSAAFRGSARHRRFLDYLVRHAMRGDGSRVKEITLGIEVFDRPESTFDPQQDTIVRVEARRLRDRLARYYREEGADSLVEIELPVGSYLPALKRRAVALESASLVILPIVDRSGQSGIVPIAASFCEDLFDGLLDAVARLPGFKLIARTSAMRAVDGRSSSEVDPDRDDVDGDDAALTARLDVALLLRATLDRDERLLRLKLRLTRGNDRTALWAGTWPLAVDADFAARDALVARVVHDVQHALLDRLPSVALPVDGNAPVAAHPVDERARDLVDRGRFLMRHGPVDAYPEALRRFRDATRIAPHYAAAHFGIARSLSYLLGMTQIAPADGVEEARRAAGEALALDPRHGDAASLLAALRQRYDHDWVAAQAGYLDAIALAPGSLFVHSNYAFGLMFSGRFAEARAELKLARELDPLDVSQRATQALLEIYRRDYASAFTLVTALIDDEPRHLLAHSLRGALHLFRNEPDLALGEYVIAHTLAPAISIGSVGMAQAYAMSGRRDEAIAERDRLIRSFDEEKRYLSPYQVAMIELRLGDLDAAFAALERCATERDPNFIAVLVDPSLDVARRDARFAELLVRHGLDRVLPQDE